MTFDKDQMICFLWDQVKRLSQWTRQRDGEVQKGYSDMCKLENNNMIEHLKVVEPEVIEMPESVVEPEAPEPEPEPIPDPEPEPIIEEVVKEVVKETVIEVAESPVETIEADNVDELLEQYKKKIQTSE